MVEMTNAEKMVADYLKENGYTLTYETSVPIVDDRELDRIWHPDFLINELGLHVEVCGADRPNDYQWRKKIYKKNDVPILFAFQVFILSNNPNVLPAIIGLKYS